MMTANELFEKLGYEHYTCAEVENYQKLLDLGFIRVSFDIAKSTLLIIYDNGFAKYEQTIEEMEDEEQIAIHQRIKELGWNFRQRKYYFEEEQ